MPQKKIELYVIGLSYSQAQSNSYALVLGETDGKRRLPIVIGHYEAQAIALEIEKMKPARPLTHDLFLNMATAFGIMIDKVVISKFHEGIFYATLYCNDGIAMHEIDSRTSDAIALAIRFNCPIYTYENIMAQAGVIYEDEAVAESNTQEETPVVKPAHSHHPFENLPFDELETELAKAIENEEYEKASQIRDEIQKRKKH